MSDPAITPEPGLQSDPISTVAPMPTLETLGCLLPHPKYAVIAAWPISPQPEPAPHLLLVTRDHEIEAQQLLGAHSVAWAEIDPFEAIQPPGFEQPSPTPLPHQLPDECLPQTNQTLEPSRLETEQRLQLDSLQKSITVTATLESLISSPHLVTKERIRQRCQALENQGFLRTPRADVVVLQTSPDSASPSDTTQQRASANYPTQLAIATGSLGNLDGLNPFEDAKSAVASTLRRLACSGATPTHIQLLHAGHPSSKSHPSGHLQENARGRAEACRHFKIQPVTGVATNQPANSLVVFGIVEELQHITTPWFKDDGDIIALIGHPIDLEDPLQGLGGSAWLQVIHQLEIGQRPRCNLVEAQCLHEAVRSLIYGGAVKSACGCDEGGLAVRIAECCMGPSQEADTPRLLGAELDLTVLNPGNNATATITTRTEAYLFGESQNRIVITTSALDAGKLLAQAKILGVPAALIGHVGGTQLRIKSTQSEDSWDLRRLHDLRREAASR